MDERANPAPTPRSGANAPIHEAASPPPSTNEHHAPDSGAGFVDRVEEAAKSVAHGAKTAAHDAKAAAHDVVTAVKPKLRGWLHAGMAPVALIAGIVLIVLGRGSNARWAATVFTVCAVLLFGTSALYHRGHWSPKMMALLKRWDHSNIFLIIAGSYTPFSLLLPPDQRKTLLIIVWGGALLGVIFRVAWVHAPRWLYTPVYVMLGWVAVFYLKPLLAAGGVALVTLVAVGGLLYTIGALVYGIKRPNPSPRWFGFHEIFHALTIAAFITHYIAASMALYRDVTPS